MTTSTTPVLDPVPLQRQTMGDAAHRLELLALFVVEAERLMRQIEEATDKQVMLERLQALAGSARHVRPSSRVKARTRRSRGSSA